ncbi:hypothetical protein Aph01nite_10700 [Acrocarpospora phusangensis]|uniref:DUF6745 domain-containing protein n=1 Tax=Acrocarpospora phusangensis TaxID=1070424 RepID=A0A919UNK2_9ACTN|nr:hypothetical protein [Acrocarpospora phusangensis]GIH22760.1 hypothetical protein Aph01nite_10700 [Acrocarpospora phusangensis]
MTTLALSPELAARITDAVTRWELTAYATGPANRPAAEEGVRAAYRQAGLPEPEQIIWFASPAQAAVAATVLAGDPETRAEARESNALPEALLELDAGAPVRDLVRTRPWERVRAEAAALLTPAAWAAACALVNADCWPRVNGLAGEIRRGIGRLAATPGSTSSEEARSAGRPRRPRPAEEDGGVGMLLRRTTLDAILGQHDAPWLAFFEAFGRMDDGTDDGTVGAGDGTGGTDDGTVGAGDGTGSAGGGTGSAGGGTGSTDGGAGGGADGGAGGGAVDLAPLDGLMRVAREAGWWWPFEHAVLICERPSELHLDDLGRLHRAVGPALAFPDGFALHAWRGMPVPPEFGAAMADLSVTRIREEDNAELRRVMLEHFGFDRYLQESGADLVHRDETGTLWRAPVADDEPLTMVEVVNSTPEPDGTSRTYFLRVPPWVTTARQGVAWTFGLSDEQYEPQVQT